MFISGINYTVQNNKVSRDIQSLAVTNICHGDTIFYQACGMKKGIIAFENSTAPCGYLCKVKDLYQLVVKLQYKVCTGEISKCKNVDIKELKSQCKDKKCDGIITEQSQQPHLRRMTIPKYEESYCNGFVYGLFCDTDEGNLIESEDITCNSNFACIDGKDRALCLSERITHYCESAHYYYSKGLVVPIPLFNFSRCGPIGRTNRWNALGPVIYRPICLGYKEQTNCSDESRVGLICEINGYLSTVAKMVICHTDLRDRPPLCDDAMDVACMQLSETCYVHKHQLCDGFKDCAYGFDESTCADLTNKTCKRKFIKLEKKGIPFQWIKDGVADCSDEEDEHGDWPVCGFGVTQRYSRLSHNSTCPEVFLCHSSFIEFTDLCDGIESCENENEVCAKSRNFYTIQDSPVDVKGTQKMFHCLNGLEKLDQFLNGNCSIANFSFVGNQVIGKTSFIQLFLPQSSNWKVDCNHIYGAYYVYLSCLNFCRNSTCILDKLVHFESCQLMYKERIFSITNNDQLTFLIRNGIDGTYHNDIFPCKSGDCIGYNKVCNLVDDCGDWSDEANCTNYFRCLDDNGLIPHSKVCDKVFDCRDFSDECNYACARNSEMIASFVVAVSGWILGVLAVLFNLVTIPVSLKSVWKSKSHQAFTNNVMLVLISVGDLLAGIFIFTISVYNVYYGASYCKNQFEWLTSITCPVVGIMNTIGILISNLSMTTLSLFRVFNISRTLAIPSPVSKRRSLKIYLIIFGIIVTAISASLIPVFTTFEDYFVDQFYHGSDNPLFSGAHNKKSHTDILEAYYGSWRLSFKSLSWRLVRQLIASMFSKDITEVPDKKIQFYGNDAVCIFKYFVRKEDPQYVFVWISLLLQIVCVIVISAAYITIAKISSHNSIKVADKATEKSITQRAQTIQRTVSVIIFIDLLSWIPFIVVCTLHSIEYMDGTHWYSIFSLVFNPLNSVINPIILNKKIMEAATKICTFLRSKCRMMIMRTYHFFTVRCKKNIDEQDVTMEDLGLRGQDQDDVDN